MARIEFSKSISTLFFLILDKVPLVNISMMKMFRIDNTVMKAITRLVMRNNEVENFITSEKICNLES